MGYQIKITYPDGQTHLRRQVFKTKAGAEKKAEWFDKHLRPEVKVVRSKEK
ncbi:hypothetical protein ACFLV5_01180 [Chloroflexota bacterium]